MSGVVPVVAENVALMVIAAQLGLTPGSEIPCNLGEQHGSTVATTNEGGFQAAPPSGCRSFL